MTRLLHALLAAGGRIAVYLYPAAFRLEYADEMREVFGDLCAHRGTSTLRLAAGGGRALFRMSLGGIAERVRQPFRSTPSPVGPRPGRGPGDRLLSNFLQDALFGIRSLVARPAFSIMAICMLAFGIAANASVFTLFNAAFLRPLPFPEPHRLIDLDETAPDWGLEYVGISYPDFEAWERLNTTFDSMAVFDGASYNLSTDSTADRVSVALVSWQLERVLGIRPALGRGFGQADDSEGAEKVALLTDATWRERFAADPAVLGTVIRLDSEPHTIIGVLPPEAIFPADMDLWVPLSTVSHCCEPGTRSGSWWLRGVGRLAEGVSIEQARTDLQTAHATLVEEFGSSREISTPRLQPLVERYLGPARPMMMLLLAAVGILLLIACANVGGLLLARAATRQREVGIRMALGAGRSRIVRQLLTESLLLASAGALAGLGAATVAVGQMTRLIPDQAMGWLSFGLDVRVMGFVVGIATFSAVAFGLAPALLTSKTGPRGALQDATGRGSAGPRRRRLLGGLVVAETALAVLLLVGAGLLVQGFRALSNVEPGFRTDVLTFRLSLPEIRYGEHEERMAFFDQLTARLAGLSGVETVGLTTHPPLGGHSGYFFAADDTILADDESPVVLARMMSDDYLNTMGITLLRGRTLHPADRSEEAELVIVINETFARTFWGTTEVLGKQVTMGGSTETPYTVVGVTRDTKHYGLDEEMRPGVFLPHGRQDWNRLSMAVTLRGMDDPNSYVPAARAIVRELDAEVPIFAVQTMEEAVRDSKWAQRLASTLTGVFAGSALLLAVAGIYGTVSYAVSQRRHEIGIRMALGAARNQVVRGVMRDGLWLAGFGLAGGLVLAIAAGSAISTVLFGVSPRDPITYGVVVTLLLAATAVATLLPARRAARTNPVEALRSE